MTTEIRTSHSRRYWRRASSPRPWWPLGWLLLLGLLTLFLYGWFVQAPHIESDVADRVATRLNETRLDKNTVADTAVIADGQGVAITATAPESNSAVIHALAKSTQCHTWAGELSCPTTVQVDLNPPVAAAIPAGPYSARTHDFVFMRDGNSVTLRGEVADSASRKQLLNLANARFSEVIDELIVSNEVATDQYLLAAERSLQVLQTFRRGHASWTDTVLDAEGIASAELAEEARKRFNDSEGAPTLGDITVGVEKDSSRCDQEFDELLTRSSIRFRTASADIDAGNESLLKNLADLVAQCPGTLEIAGHTDSQGDADMNEALSLARASAVRDALFGLGIGADRLTAKGYGETQPIADNRIASGRAQNRRIVISSMTAK